jgi:hypothetical protein
VALQSLPYLPLDQAEHPQGQADHLHEGGDAPVVLDENTGVTASGPLKQP